VIISIDDYSEGNYKIVELAEKYNLKDYLLFFIDFRDENAPEQIRELDRRGCKCGSHTITHSHLTKISLEQVKWEIGLSKERIEGITGKPCEWLCYPRGYYTPEIIELVRDAGYKYARTTRLGNGETPFEMGGIHLTYNRKEYLGISPYEIALKSRMTHFWGHYFEAIRDWGEFERIFRMLQKKHLTNKSKNAIIK